MRERGREIDGENETELGGEMVGNRQIRILLVYYLWAKLCGEEKGQPPSVH